jgi:hypothetical protein
MKPCFLCELNEATQHRGEARLIWLCDVCAYIWDDTNRSDYVLSKRERELLKIVSKQ